MKLLNAIKKSLVAILANKIIAIFIACFFVFIEFTNHLVSKHFIIKEVKTLIPKINATDVVNVNNDLATFISKCGDFSGGAFIEFNYSTKVIHFIEVFANDPFSGGVYPTKYIKGNDFYMRSHTVDDFAMQVISGVQDYGYFNFQSELWEYSKFFISLKKNIWKIMNERLIKEKITTKAIPKALYITTLKNDSNIVYIFAITISAKTYCDFTNAVATDREKIHITGSELNKLKINAGYTLNVFTQ